ncbi:small glutamine-rich tetratricopeptide repeat-containing protein alpha-like [Trichosurus vulpecula]|uniref:small glutamine-rich tetratricopeptide repeat-containing protein alpha-like n=1 Tax=Trichosurus vulpecula TaxID=9337 RepID=UPI00186B0DC6|nr:small glutamine-rich tetratricopeptide repeat-containing protein alpha-like [Trichosurus vulpecula]
MEKKKRLVYSIIQYLHDQLQHGGLSPDAQQSLEASIQCLETAFEVTVEDRDLAVSQTLSEIFQAFTGKKEMPSIRRNCDPVPHHGEAITEAERLKAEGNEQMKIENFEAAVSFYGKAIELNPANAVYFCNRAAAYSKLGNYAGAVEDCKRAIGIDPYYSKAYGRMGVALSSLKKHKEAVGYYKKALKFDPDNVTYKSNLMIAEQKMKERPSTTRGPVGCNLAGLLHNSSFRSVASNLMNNPQIQEIMAGVMAGGYNPSAAARASRSSNVGPGLVGRGQHMQQQNPEWIEQLRSQVRNCNSTVSKNNQE